MFECSSLWWKNSAGSPLRKNKVFPYPEYQNNLFTQTKLIQPTFTLSKNNLKLEVESGSAMLEWPNGMCSQIDVLLIGGHVTALFSSFKV